MTTRPRIDPDCSRRVAARLAPSLVDQSADVVAITVDQTNVSQVVGGEVIVKWLLRPVPVPHPGVEVLRHLTLVGFAEMPAFLGAEVVDDAVVAIVQRFVPGARDGWDWFVDLLTGELAAGAVPDGSIAAAAHLGGLAARLHRALATPSDVCPDPVHSAGTTDELDRGRRLLERAVDVASAEVATRVRNHQPAIAAAVDMLAVVDELAVQPIHGDLHVGQMLRAGDRIIVTDFDGDPLAAGTGDVCAVTGVVAGAGGGAGRWQRRSPMVDLAALVQSIDHVGRVVVKRRPELAGAVDAFLQTGIPAALDSYGAVAPVDERVLWPLRVIQELHELVYAAEHLPRWEYVPDAALGAMFGG